MKKITIKIIKYLIIVFISYLLLMISLFMYALFTGCSDEEYNFVMQENENIRIHMTTRNCGATTNFSRNIYLTDKDINFIKDITPIIHIAGNVPNMYWKNKKTFVIETNSGRIDNFRNYVIINKNEYNIILINNLTE